MNGLIGDQSVLTHDSASLLMYKCKNENFRYFFREK